jgi:tRNA G18 (ribose-2'-O)-methylase SpoU
MNSLSNIHNVQSLDLPELQPYRTLRRPKDHFKKGIFVAEGEKVVYQLIASDFTIISFLMTQEWYNELIQHCATHLSTLHNSAAVYIAEKELLETIVGCNLHQGIMAVAKLPAQLSLEEVMKTVSTPHLLVALDGLVSAENVGVVVRNCAAFGVDALLVGETSSSPYLRRAVRNSMGTVFQLPIVHVDDLVCTLETLKHSYGTRVVAAHPHEHSFIHNTSLDGNTCIVVGNEGNGISPKILVSCTDRVAIPMMNETDSLNVGSASAVFLYEARKQRQK